MTKTPGDFAVRPDGDAFFGPNLDSAQPFDLLSGLIRSVHLRSDGIFCCGPESPFAISFDHSGGILHVVEHGAFELQLTGERSARRYDEGDVVLLPTGKAHVIRHGRRTPARRLAAGDLNKELVHDPSRTLWLTGTFSFVESAGVQMLYGLPPLIELRGAGKLDLMWFNASAMCFAREQVSPAQGSAQIMSKLLELLFVYVLREWAERPGAVPSWLTGAVDPVIGEAITAIHAEPEVRWTIQRLAAESNLSRSAFAERFARCVGQSPAAYVTQVRLERASDLLMYTKEPLGVIATNVGYDSGAAFSRAFSRRYGASPSRWRHRARSSGEASANVHHHTRA